MENLEIVTKYIENHANKKMGQLLFTLEKQNFVQKKRYVIALQYLAQKITALHTHNNF